MGRPATFDTAQAARAARAVFWDQGYEQTSMSQLQQATGLGASSIYHAFGSKRGLFDAAVRSYLDEVILPRLAPLQATTVAPDALERYLVGMRAELTRAPRSALAHGCLLLNSATTTLGDDAGQRAVLADYHATLSAAFARGVAARHPDEPASERERRTLHVLALWIATLTLARADPEAALASLDGAISALD